MDLISDLFSRLNNAQKVGKTPIHIIYNKFSLKIIQILQEENLISHWTFPKGDNPKDPKNYILNSYKYCYIHLKNMEKNQNLGSFQIKRISKNSGRQFIKKNSLWAFDNGLGFFILSTSKGIITCRTAKRLNVGGEIICEIKPNFK